MGGSGEATAVPWNTRRPRPLPTAPVRYPTQRRCFATRSTRQCGGAVGGGGEQGSQPPPLLPPGPGRCGARPAKPSPALPGARRGQARAEEGRAGLFYAPPPPEPRTERSGEEREGGPAPPVLPSPHTWLPRHSSQLCPAAGCSSCARGTDGAGRWGGGGEGEGAVGGRVQGEGGYRGRGTAGQGLVGGSRAAM